MGKIYVIATVNVQLYIGYIRFQMKDQNKKSTRIQQQI